MAKHQSQLDRLSSTEGSSNNRTKMSSPNDSFPDWLLPTILVMGFISIFLLLFKDRITPATKVNVQAVVTIRKAVVEDELEPILMGSQKGELLFQASGWVEPDPFPIIVPALVGGIVDQVSFLEGESVKAGDVLAKLINEDAQIDLAIAEAQLQTLKSELSVQKAKVSVINSRRSGSSSSVDSARARLLELEDRLRRMESVPSGSIARVDLESVRLQYKQQQALISETLSGSKGIGSELEMAVQEINVKQSAIREAELGVERAKLALDRHTIRAPVDGIIKIQHVVPGSKRFIQADDSHSSEIVEMYNPKKLQARIDVPLSEAAGLSIGQQVELVCDLIPETVLKGVVTRIDGRADIQRNTLQVKVSIKNPDSRLRPEMLVRGRFFSISNSTTRVGVTSSQDSRLSIFAPTQAITGSDQVWVVGSGNKAEKRTVQLGKEIRDDFQLVVSGLKSGEQVILPPHINLKSGKRVKFDE